ncbi:PUA domain-containing protein, partial [Campylobacter concisus]|uniref:PUA domain-containing protein n=1 Tax=Campylobacter concisus TaxID=199 RepID=UPI00292A44AE
LKTKGSMMIDTGAVAALHLGKSLLSVGVTGIEGDFHKGDAICILNTDKHEIARGLTNYAASDAKKIMGHKSSAFENILGYGGCAEMIHRDDLVLHAGKKS